ncbi:MAG TPA: response regulator [Holophaga sp.]|nr:response regulator [Holophaga sp.]
MESKGRLLLADDEEMFLGALAQLLEMEGWTVDRATTVPGARELLETRPYDVLVSDIQMPGGKVLDLVRQIPALNGGLPVVLMTGHPSMDTALEAMGNAVLAYLVKPFPLEDLTAHLLTGTRLRKVQALALDSSRRLQTWADEMRAVEADIRSAPASMGVMPLSGLVGLVLGNLAASTLELKQLLDLALQTTAAQGVCGIRECPRLGLLQETLRDGVEVLERTKGSFKSKELGDLRRRFSSVLEGHGRPDGA